MIIPYKTQNISFGMHYPYFHEVELTNINLKTN